MPKRLPPTDAPTVGYFARNQSAAPETVAFLHEWARITGQRILPSDFDELAVAFEAHIGAFAVVASLDLEGVAVPGAQEPEWR